MKKENLCRNLTIFFVLVFLITWLLWLPSYLDNNGSNIPGILLLFGQFATLGPLLASIIILKKTEEKGSVKKFLKSAWNWSFNKKWLLFIILVPFILTIVSYLLVILIDNLSFSLPTPPMPIYFFVFFLFLAGPLEEFGWRGYAMPRLLKKYNPFITTLIIGLIWGLWHLPLHFMANTIQSSFPFWQFILVTMEAAFLYTYLYKKTNGNLTVAILFHYFANLACIFEYFQSDIGRYIFFGLQLIVVIYLVIKEKKWFFIKAKALD